MRPLIFTLPALWLALANPVFACSPPPGWTEPTPEIAFQRAGRVVHGIVLSKSGTRNRMDARIAVYKVLKGQFSGDTVSTASTATCGINDFEVGKEYVFFLSPENNFVSHLLQPSGLSARDILRALENTPPAR